MNDPAIAPGGGVSPYSMRNARVAKHLGPARLVITPQQRWWSVNFGELWRYREVIYFLVWRDFKVRYRQTLLGAAWAAIQPLLTVAIFTLLFSRLAGLSSDGVAYPLYVLVAFIPWAFFSLGVSTSTNCMISNQDLVKRIYFPRLAIPLAGILSGLPDLFVGLILLVVFALYYGLVVGPAALMLPLFLLQAIAATVAIGLILAAANTRFRDIGHTVPFVLQVGLLVTPVGYSSDVVPEQWQLLYALNPMVGVIDGLRMALFDSPMAIDTYLVSLGMTLVTLVGGVLYFNRNERKLADIL
jgi:lipopolysaccharide transport system permease protein